MERYIVNIIATNSAGGLKLLVPLHQEQQVSDLLEQTRLRYVKYSAIPLNPILSLYGNDGPILDLDDVLKDVILNPKEDVVFASCATLSPPRTDHEYEGKVRDPIDASLPTLLYMS